MEIHADLPFKSPPTGGTEIWVSSWRGPGLHRVVDGRQWLPAGHWRHAWHSGTYQLPASSNTKKLSWMMNSYVPRLICPEERICWCCPALEASSASAERLETPLGTGLINLTPSSITHQSDPKLQTPLTRPSSSSCLCPGPPPPSSPSPPPSWPWPPEDWRTPHHR